ncbi:uncharacterized protein LOC116777734 isoform X2 [Danaus plexippus]|uniref:uncharacterized protein LOC116777734 isoform X2 n=1 Tax=Danaus plexippus TaxID=13037 RepID=UPI002AB07994|nr:uncharacterized protein LOC116777734 isoform X2 [Danaus plexippus]
MAHPQYPQSNVSKFSGYHPDKYALDEVSPTLKTDESLTPNRPPCLTQRTISKFLQPLTRELVEVQPRPTIDELPDAVIENMVKRDKAFWVDKPGANAYTLHDAYYNYGMTTEKVLPPHQDVFPRSYQYDLDCVKYRRHHACDGLKANESDVKPLAAHCNICTSAKARTGTKNQVFGTESTQKRWRYYPDVTATLTPDEIRKRMDELGRPFKNEACRWYNKHYPTQKYNCIMRKFSK